MSDLPPQQLNFSNQTYFPSETSESEEDVSALTKQDLNARTDTESEYTIDTDEDLLVTLNSNSFEVSPHAKKAKTTAAEAAPPHHALK